VTFKDANSKKLSRVRSFVSGDCFVIGRVLRAFDLVTHVFSDGVKCKVMLRDSDVLKLVRPVLVEDGPYCFYYLGQHVMIMRNVSKLATWLCGSWSPSRYA
jgi:ubiquitin-conjugating enzyme E2 O